MLPRSLLLAAALAVAAFAQKYDGPTPPKPDLPYLKHADNLIPTEAVTARQEKKKDDITHVIDGANSSARTPLASPIFLMKADKLIPDHLQLFKLESRNGRREILFAAKKQPKAIRIVVTRLSPDNIYRIEVDESLEPGEYSLSPSESELAFCFQVY